jgi:hypothetical protein
MGLSMDCLGSLTTLGSLSLSYSDSNGWSPLSDGLTELRPLAGLTSLAMPGRKLGLAAWAGLAQLPLLAQLQAGQVAAASATPLAALTCLRAGCLVVQEGAPPGALAVALPSLQRLEAEVRYTGPVSVCSSWQLAACMWHVHC